MFSHPIHLPLGTPNQGLLLGREQFPYESLQVIGRRSHAEVPRVFSKSSVASLEVHAYFNLSIGMFHSASNAAPLTIYFLLGRGEWRVSVGSIDDAEETPFFPKELPRNEVGSVKP